MGVGSIDYEPLYKKCSFVFSTPWAVHYIEVFAVNKEFKVLWLIKNFSQLRYFYAFFFVIKVEDEKVAHIYSVIMLQRLDKRKDRVEISPEQLSDASTQAEVKSNCYMGLWLN